MWRCNLGKYAFDTIGGNVRKAFLSLTIVMLCFLLYGEPCLMPANEYMRESNESSYIDGLQSAFSSRNPQRVKNYSGEDDKINSKAKKQTTDSGFVVGEIFSNAQIVGTLDFYSETSVIRTRYVEIAFDILEGALFARANKYSITLNLFPDVIFEAYINQVIKNPSGSYSWIGEIIGIPEAEVIFVVKNGFMMGNVVLPGYIYQIRYAGNHIHSINEVDSSFSLPDLPPIPIYSEPTDVKEGIADDGSIIDVLVAYTSAARSGTGGTSAMQNLIDLAITETNVGFSNSNVNQRVRLAHSVEVNYSEAGFDSHTTLSRLRQTSDGYMDNIHNLRDQYSADLVVLIVSPYSMCGRGYIMTNVSSGFAPYAFSVVSRTCATGYYTFAHEMGHNMGSRHDRANTSYDGAYSYSYGYQAPNSSFRTIMAYNCPSGCSRVNYWSNPKIYYNGQPMGVIYTAYNAADNRRSLNNTAYTVSNFRKSRFSLDIESGSGGTTTPSPGIHTYNEGTNVSVTASPNSNFRFDKWTGDASGNSKSIVVNMDRDKSIKANFIRIYKLEILSGDGGTTNPVPGTYLYEKNQQVSISAIPEDYHVFSNWSGDVSGTANPRVIIMGKNKSIKANFRPVLAPSNFSGSKSTNRNLFQIDNINTLNWIANPANQGINIVNYRIYKINGTTTLLKEVSSSTFKFLHRQAGKDPQRYAIVGVLNDGREGFAAFITVQ